MKTKGVCTVVEKCAVDNELTITRGSLFTNIRTGVLYTIVPKTFGGEFYFVVDLSNGLLIESVIRGDKNGIKFRFLRDIIPNFSELRPIEEVSIQVIKYVES